eukprot:6624799-Pyramimonas_sp.AAC.1
MLPSAACHRMSQNKCVITRQQYSLWCKSQSNGISENGIKSSGTSRLPQLPLILYLPSHFTKSD